MKLIRQGVLVILIALGWSFVSELEYVVYAVLGIRPATLGLHPGMLIGLYAEGIAVALMVLCYRKRPWLTVMPLEGRTTVRQYGLGALVGLGMFSAIWGVVVLGGGYRIVGVLRLSQVGLISLYLGGFGIQSLLEEVLCRGYLMGYWLKQGRVLAAVMINTLFFALLHGLNPGFDLRAGVGVFCFGLLMSELRLVTGNLWLGAAVHGAWNFAEGILYGTAVSGMPNIGLILHSQPVAGHVLVTGGTFGIERSLPALVVLLGAIGWCGLKYASGSAPKGGLGSDR